MPASSELPFDRVLAIGAHADDIELGCGATIARARREGREVYALTLSKHDPWFDDATHDIASEWNAALDRLGVSAKQRELHGFLGCRDDDFAKRRGEILAIIESARDRFRPDAVLFHSANDTNQDHQQVHAEALRALKRHATLLCYEFPNNMLRFDGRFFVHFDEADLRAKHESLAEYRSLRAQWGDRNDRYGLDTVSYLDPDSIDAIAKARGHQAGGRLAECFEVLRWIS